MWIHFQYLSFKSFSMLYILEVQFGPPYLQFCSKYLRFSQHYNCLSVHDSGVLGIHFLTSPKLLRCAWVLGHSSLHFPLCPILDHKPKVRRSWHVTHIWILVLIIFVMLTLYIYSRQCLRTSNQTFTCNLQTLTPNI
jgi:hypothetical protein